MNQHLRPTWKTAVVAAMLAWAYFPTLGELFRKWSDEPQYSHGFIVPLFSLFLLHRNQNLIKGDARPMPWLGYGLLALALGFRAVAALLYFTPLDAFSLVVCLTGLTLLAGGRALMRGAWQSLVFLLFMIPLPYQIERMMGAELQHIATLSSTFLLQSLGQPAVAEGNNILIDDVKLGVVEACSGLRMLMTFAAFCVAAVFLLERHWISKLLILGSMVPIALITNILRITGTGMFHVWMKESSSRDDVLKFIHDFNGYLMMPVGLAFLVAELWVLRHLLIEPEARPAA